MTTAATLVMPAGSQIATAPLCRELSARVAGEPPWHADTLEFWKEVWASPMVSAFIAADVPGLVLIAKLIDRFNYGDVSLAGEIRLQRQCFGLTPLDRRRLSWETVRASEAEERAQRRQAMAVPQPTGARDPRRNLRAVK